ncbi:C2H2 finger domain transcription factor CON7 [Pleurostoma richardsiae]|uniref:C2H2 finger domain transcription factor CON7 n=1 Tax=Pleurostoma richardsiae TaxID=41990 RepID=A0AA38VC03_9PEZI|nr:C2H2 finger domain transcription factor CON7 [Pleurostoma richardsiae]
MFVAPTQHQHAFVEPEPLLPRPGSHQLGSLSPEATATKLLSPPGNSMERTAPEYSQSDHASAAQYATQQEVRSNNYPTSATPTSEYGVYPPSARSSSFPEHIQRPYHPASNHSGSSGGMAQTPTNPSIAAPSPTYAHGQYSPYAPPPQDMSHGYQHPSGGMYAQPRPDWTGYGQQHGAPLTPGHHVFPQTPTSAAPQARPNQVYSFVPIPGAQQHKRPRRRYEEIERMYKCGWNGCEKAYGTLNHLNAHVTMQSHGQKRTPEEFKEIRKEWKARKKEEEAQRKAEEERQRQAAAAAAQNGGPDGQPGPDGSQPPASYPGSRPVQLPPITYQTTQYPAPPSGGMQQPLPDYGANYVHPNYQPASPYGQPSQQMYNQPNGGQPGQ